MMQVNPNSLFVADPLDVIIRLDSAQFDLVFLDPPFYGGYLFDLNNPKKPPYQNYPEFLEYIVSIFWQSCRVLKQNGAFLLRINPLAPYNARLFLDRIFGKNNFRAEVIWENQPFGRGFKGPNVNFETVLFYSKSDKFTYHELVKDLSEKEIKTLYRHKDDRGYYKLWTLIDKVDRPNQIFSWNGVLPPAGSSWKYSKNRLDEFLANGEIVLSGKYPKRKIYLSKDKNITPLGFVWDDIADLPPEKEQIDKRLLKAIEMASNPGDLILDPFINPISLGALTNSQRNWVGVSQFEISPRDFKQFQSCRIEDLSENEIFQIEVVDNGNISQKLSRLVLAETRAVDPLTIIENNGQSFGFLVGINHYKDGIGELRFCINDVVELGKTLETIGYQVKTIHDDMEDDNLIPWRSNIEAELRYLTQSLDPEDTLYVHFSCHGTLIDNEAMIITSDTRIRSLQTSVLPLANVINIMKSGRARKLVLSLDICHGGIEMGRAFIDSEFIKNVYDNAEGFALLAASTAQQVAYEINQYSHGLFELPPIGQTKKESGLKSTWTDTLLGRVSVLFSIVSVRSCRSGYIRR